MKLLLDEHISLVVAVELRRLGHDAICVAERSDLRGIDDCELLEWACEHGRVVVSADRATMPTAAERVRGQGGHAGVVVVSPERFPLAKRNPGPLIAAIASLAATSGGDTHRDLVTWLSPAGSPDG